MLASCDDEVGEVFEFKVHMVWNIKTQVHFETEILYLQNWCSNNNLIVRSLL